MPYKDEAKQKEAVREANVRYRERQRKRLWLSPELMQKVEALAKKEGKTPEQIVVEAVKGLAREYNIKC